MSAEPMKGAFANAEPIAQPLTYAPPKPGGRDTEALVRQHLPMVRRLAWHVHGSMSTIVDIEDLVQVAERKSGVLLIREYGGVVVHGHRTLRIRHAQITHTDCPGQCAEFQRGKAGFPGL